MSELEVLRDLPAIETLSGEWDALAMASPRSTPFQTAAWCVPWTKHMAIMDPAVLTVREGRDLVAVAPFFVWGEGGQRTVSLLGAGVSDHLDIVAVVGRERLARDAVRDWLDAERDHWTDCAFDEIGPSALLRDLPPPRAAGLAVETQSVCPVLSWVRGAAFTSIIPAGQMARIRRDERRARALGVTGVERVRRDAVADAMETLFALHRRRWAEMGQPGVLGGSNVRAMHLEAAARLDALGALRLYVLRVGGRPAAVIYGFAARDRVHLYLSGIEPDLHRASPGTLAIAAVLADALEEGACALDFLRGREKYKYAWGAVDEPNVKLTCTPVPPLTANL